MIKNFEEYINEDYFSKLANRKDSGEVRKENEITEYLVRSFVDDEFKDGINSITIRKENGKTIVDIDGSFYMRIDVDYIPFQFGEVTGDFNCYGCKLKSLEGCPQEVGGDFRCAYCDNLTSLEGCPQEVGGEFDCYGCKSLTSIKGCPKEVGGYFGCENCGKQFTEQEIKSLCNVKRKIYV